MDGKSVRVISIQEPLSWKVYVDGAANHEGPRVGLVLISPERITIEKSLRLDFSTTNNEKNGRKGIKVFSDSRLVVGQVQGELEARDPIMQEYLNQAEAINKVIVGGHKKRLDDAKGKWVEELLHVLWTYRTTPYRSTRETLFSMTYGAEAVIPLETRFPMLRTNSFSSSGNDGLLEKMLGLIKEQRENAMVQLAYYQHKLKQGYDANVKLRPLTLGDLVLRKVMGTTKNPTWGKLGPKWEGLYRITSMARIGACYLKDLEEKVIPRPWNVNNFRRYYY
nr:uncharacterized protein LOC111992596 [Quercus suber]